MRTDTAPLDCGHDPAMARPAGTATDEHGRRTCIPCHGAAAYRRTVEYGAIVTGYDTGLPSGRTLADAVAPGAGYVAGPGAGTGRNLGTVTAWDGAVTVGEVIRRSTYRNGLTGTRMTALTVRTAGGRILYGRYGSDWSQAVTLRPSRSAR